MRSIVLVLLATLGLTSFTALPGPTPPEMNVNWYSWEEAVEACRENPKKIFVDVYTNWCGWCKRMDANTFEQPEVAAYLNENFYPVKLNAEQKEDIQFDGHTFKFLSDVGRRGVHQFAATLLNGQMSYPTVVYLDEKFARIMISKGYKEPEPFMKELKYTAEEHYKTTKWEEFNGGS